MPRRKLLANLCFAGVLTGLLVAIITPAAMWRDYPRMPAGQYDGWIVMETWGGVREVYDARFTVGDDGVPERIDIRDGDLDVAVVIGGNRIAVQADRLRVQWEPKMPLKAWRAEGGDVEVTVPRRCLDDFFKELRNRGGCYEKPRCRVVVTRRLLLFEQIPVGVPDSRCHRYVSLVWAGPRPASSLVAGKQSPTTQPEDLGGAGELSATITPSVSCQPYEPPVWKQVYENLRGTKAYSGISLPPYMFPGTLYPVSGDATFDYDAPGGTSPKLVRKKDGRAICRSGGNPHVHRDEVYFLHFILQTGDAYELSVALDGLSPYHWEDMKSKAHSPPPRLYASSP